jgi:hypothetical protein
VVFTYVEVDMYLKSVYFYKAHNAIEIIVNRNDSSYGLCKLRHNFALFCRTHGGATGAPLWF